MMLPHQKIPPQLSVDYIIQTSWSYFTDLGALGFLISLGLSMQGRDEANAHCVTFPDMDKLQFTPDRPLMA